MALGRDVLDAIIREHSYRPIAGDVLLIGQQTVSLSRGDVIDMMRDHRVAPVEDDGAATDGDGGDGGMSAAAFFRLLGVGAVRSLDARAEGADIIHELDEPIPEQLKGSVDFIIDNGAIGDVFSAAAALHNHAELLRPGGRLIAVSNFSGHFDPYSIPSAVWYLDYFVVNGFADCKVYILVYIPDWQPNAFYLNIECLLDPTQEIRTFLSGNEMSVVVFAEKAAASTVHGTPTHARLRSPAEWERYRHNLGRINQSPRPHLVRSRGLIGDIDVRGGHLFVNRDYAAVTPAQARREANDGDDDPDPAARLKILCVGTGRDGTQSLYHMARHVLAAAGDGEAMHEYCCREFYQAFCNLRESGFRGYADAIDRMIAACRFECIVGNGYAALLPSFAERYGRGLKVVHLYRADRDACIASLVRNCEMFPTAYGYYSASSKAVIKRMAAFHLGEMTRQQWDRLSLEEKFGWYYDRTHSLVREHLHLFDDHMEVSTEELNDEAIRRNIGRFVGNGGAVSIPPKARLNASTVDIGSFPPEHRHKMHWLLGRLNIEEMAADDLYAVDYFLEKYIAWTGYQIENAPQLAQGRMRPPDEVAAELERALKVVRDRLRELELLRDQIRKGEPEHRGA